MEYLFDYNICALLMIILQLLRVFGLCELFIIDCLLLSSFTDVLQCLFWHTAESGS